MSLHAATHFQLSSGQYPFEIITSFNNLNFFSHLSIFFISLHNPLEIFVVSFNFRSNIFASQSLVLKK